MPARRGGGPPAGGTGGGPGANEFVLLPERGVRAGFGQPLFVGAMVARSTEPARRVTFGWPAGGDLREGPYFPFRPADIPPDYTSVTVEVVDSIHENAPKLVRMSDEAALVMRAQSPAIRLVPVRDYAPLDVAAALPIQPPAGATSGPVMTVQVGSALDGSPIPDAAVVALTDARLRLGDHGVTDAQGRVSLRLGAGTVEELFVDPPPSGFWGAFQRNVPIAASHAVRLEAVDLSSAGMKDALRHFCGPAVTGADGAGVRVAVIDTGIDTGHPDVPSLTGRNTVTGEAAGDFGDNGLGHGTHIAGIIAGRGAPPGGVGGLAPGVDLYVYRVFGAGQGTAKNYAIAKALIYASDAECHLINLSLGGVVPDEVLRDAVQDARDHGALVVCAAGNAGRQPVGVPASYGLAVAAMGRVGTFPAGAREEADVDAPVGSDPDDFVAGFTNVGGNVEFIAPGVGIVSMLPGGYGPRRGTSMAAAAATGMAARLLSAQPSLLSMPADAARAAAMHTHLTGQARSMGFGLQFEGYGML